MILDTNGKEISREKEPKICSQCDTSKYLQTTRGFGGWVTVNCIKCGAIISRERES